MAATWIRIAIIPPQGSAARGWCPLESSSRGGPRRSPPGLRHAWCFCSCRVLGIGIGLHLRTLSRMEVTYPCSTATDTTRGPSKPSGARNCQSWHEYCRGLDRARIEHQHYRMRNYFVILTEENPFIVRQIPQRHCSRVP